MENQNNQNNTERKTYSTPKLVEYGDIKQLTLSTGMGSFNDGRRDKTH